MIEKKTHQAFVCCMMLSCLTAMHAAAADSTVTEQPQTEKMGGLSGTPVNSAISGGGLVPKGAAAERVEFFLSRQG
jgi:hypothetical protein